MNDFCYIDNRDIYADFGVIIAENGYSELLSFPAMEEPAKNNWAEHNGVEVDLSAPRFLPRKITVPFARIGSGETNDFLSFLAAPGYRSVSIPALSGTWRLRLTENPAMEVFSEADIFSATFVEDAPVRTANYPPANADTEMPSVLSLDGKTLDKYGIIVTGGLGELVRMPGIKETLTRANSMANGQFYDAGFVRFSEREVTFTCCLTGFQTADFRNLYNAFFGDLTKPGERILSCYGKAYPCYYRNSANFRLLSHAGPVVCEFDVTICIIR